jgi:hypothetical protein
MVREQKLAAACPEHHRSHLCQSLGRDLEVEQPTLIK